MFKIYGEGVLMHKEKRPISEPAVLGVADFGGVSGTRFTRPEIVILAGMMPATDDGRPKCDCGTVMQRAGSSCLVCPNCGTTHGGCD